MTTPATPVEAKPVEQADAATQEATALAVHGSDPTGFLSIIRTAAENKTDPATMRELLNVYKDAQAQRAEEAYAEAIVQFRRIVRPIIMTGHRDDRKTGGQVHYDYAELTTTIEQIQPALDQCQLTPTWQFTKSDVGYVELDCVVRHILGHKERSLPFGSPVGEGRKGQTPVQVRQGVVTTLKRVTLFAALGLTTKEDDRNLQGAEQGEEPKKPQAPGGPEDDIKTQFWQQVQEKMGVKLSRGQAGTIFARVQQYSGYQSAAECLAYISREDVQIGADGTVSQITDEPPAEPLEDPQAPAAADLPQPASASTPQPPSSDRPWQCDECLQRFKVKPAQHNGNEGKRCLGHVTKVGA